MFMLILEGLMQKWLIKLQQKTHDQIATENAKSKRNQSKHRAKYNFLFKLISSLFVHFNYLEDFSSFFLVDSLPGPRANGLTA